MKSVDLLRLNSFGLDLHPLDPRELLLAKYSIGDIYIFKDDVYEKVLYKGSKIESGIISGWIKNNIDTVYLEEEDMQKLVDKLSESLLKNSRSLSIGDAIKNGIRQINLLTLNMNKLYEDPLNDELLQKQFQSTTNFARFLIKNKSITSELYRSFSKQNHYYIHAQPMLSSIMLLGFMQTFGQYHERELENFFLISYFKDLGIASIPKDLLDKQDLSNEEKMYFKNHSEHSVELVEGRLPFNKNQLNMIRYHHILNNEIFGYNNEHKRVESDQFAIVGIETTMLGAVDALIAMISERPFQDPMALFDALSLLKRSMSKEYPTEFKQFVNFVRKFLG